MHEVPDAEDVGVETLYAVGFVDEPQGMVQSAFIFGFYGPLLFGVFMLPIVLTALSTLRWAGRTPPPRNLPTA